MFLFHVCYLVAGLIVVQFDGSFKVATVDGRTRMASAAATISYSHDDNQCEQIWYIGGKHPDTSRIKTSAEAEFEGLILGLEGLLAWQESLAPFVDGGILVQGDCKTAIQQMQGRSRPRKLAHLCDHANELVQKIPWPLQFEHCPREQNVLCDRLCFGLLASKQAFVVDAIRSSLLYMLKEGANSEESLPDLHAKFLLPGKTLLNGTSRLRLFSILAKMAWLQRDYRFLMEIGVRIQKLADVLRSSSGNRPISTTDDVTSLLDLKIEGVMCEILSLNVLGKEDEALKIARRERAFLLRHGGGKDTIAHVLANPVPTAIFSLDHDINEWSREWKETPLDVDKVLIQYTSTTSISPSHGREDEDTPHPLALAIQQLLSVRHPFLSAEPISKWVSVHPANSGNPPK
eukprot:scaffold7575_cov159-Amphora_coffeaeformis.AAC.6